MTEETQTPAAAVAPPQEESFEALLEQSLRPIKEGEVVKGTILRIDADHVLVDIAYKSEGLIATWEFAREYGAVYV